MTLKEYNYWGAVPYMTTITDERGKPIGIAYADGTLTMLTASKREGVVWDGGQLLPDSDIAYVDSINVCKAAAQRAV